MYTAKQVANYVIEYGLKNNIAISNLKLQKLLYFIWIDYYKQTKSFLFDDSFEAWKFGPVIPDVYYDYCIFGGFSIPWADENIKSGICAADKNIIASTIDRFKNTSVSNMVEKTHQPNKPWDITYRNQFGDDVIAFEDIIRLEC